ncbi:MAG TPA: CDP-archaeol synthase [Candidatus Nanoarchaeia archaeon]|nr:CDP-archaeol synthase [Candidatus Nanoarchaeia archaeon]
MLLELVLKSLFFFLPAYFANMAPILFRWFPVRDKAINKKIFGEHKTWRGLIAGTIVGGIIFSLQKLIHASGWQKLALIDYNDFSLLLGFLMGFGALSGDLLKSYYKRKAGLAPGKSWIPFDQLDFVIGGLVLGFFVYVPPAEVALILLAISPLLHVLTNYLGYLLKINPSKL